MTKMMERVARTFAMIRIGMAAMLLAGMALLGLLGSQGAALAAQAGAGNGACLWALEQKIRV